MAHLGARLRRIRCVQRSLRQTHNHIPNQHAFQRAVHTSWSLPEQLHRLLCRPRPLLRNEPALQRDNVDSIHACIDTGEQYDAGSDSEHISQLHGYSTTGNVGI